MTGAWVVALKELRELARDRRTLALLFLVPVLLYPGLLILSEQLALVGMRQVESTPVSVGVAGDVPPGFEELLTAVPGLVVSSDPPSDVGEAVRSAALAGALEFHESTAPDGISGWVVSLVHDPTDDRSRRARTLLSEALVAWERALVGERLVAEGLPPGLSNPAEVVERSVAAADDVGGWALGRFLPLLLVMVTLLGTFHSAVDVGAGERERGTLEMLLTTPLPTGEIVVGKFVAVALVGILSAGLNLAAMIITFRTGLVRFGGALGLEFALGLQDILGILGTLVPLALLFGALFLGISVRARSFREAQHSLTPVYLAAFIPALLPMFSGIELSPAMALLPVGGLSLVLRDFLSGDPTLMPGLIAIGSTLLLSAVALRFAIRSFGSEAVLYGSESPGSGAPHEPPGPVVAVEAGHTGFGRSPTVRASLGFVAAVGLLFFYFGARLQLAFGEVGLFLSEWLLLGAPAIAFVFAGRYSPRLMLSLSRPGALDLLAGVLIAVGGLTTGWLLAWAQSFVLPVPVEFLQATETLLSDASGARLVWLLFLIALTPALCEEFAFRGVLLGGTLGRLSPGRAIALNALVFGAFHLSTETVFRFVPTAWLGALLAVTVWRTRSIWIAVVMHFINNGSIVVLGAVPSMRATLSDPGSAPPGLVVLGGTVALLAGLRILLRRKAGGIRTVGGPRDDRPTDHAEGE